MFARKTAFQSYSAADHIMRDLSQPSLLLNKGKRKAKQMIMKRKKSKATEMIMLYNCEQL